jgi:hypothetical protein
MNKIQEFKLQAGIDDNPDQEGLDLFADLLIKECARIASGNDGQIVLDWFGINASVYELK